MPEPSFTVCVVDDDESIRRALKRLLRSEGYHVVTFGSAEDFLESYAARGKACLVLDIRLPGITGLDLYEKVVSSVEKVPVIFMTAHDSPQWQERARAAGAIAYLRKPFDQHSMLDAVRFSLQQAGGEQNENLSALPISPTP